MNKARIETGVGVFVLIGLACVAYLTIQLGKMEWGGGDSYRLYAKFSSVSGLKEGALIEIAGVPVGKVGVIALDHEDMTAKVELRLDQGIEIDDECIAAVKTSGLIGDKYIKLVPGGGLEILEEGGRIYETQPAVDIEELMGKYVFGEAE